MMTSLAEAWPVRYRIKFISLHANQINSDNFNTTTLKFTEKSDNTFSHVFIFGNIFA